MRPKKKILLAGSDPERTGCLRYLFATYHYAVIVCDRAAEAEARLQGTQWDLLLCDWPLDGVERLLERAKAIDWLLPTLLLAHEAERPPEGCDADCILGIDNCSSADLLDRAMILSRGKRGPRPARKPIASVSLISDPKAKIGA